MDKLIKTSRTPEQIAADRKADADLALFERICEEAPALFDQSDAKIAADCEELFGIPAKDILAQFAREDETSFPTVELIMMAHDPHFFGS